jgi:hypothetical protein
MSPAEIQFVTTKQILFGLSGWHAWTVQPSLVRLQIIFRFVVHGTIVQLYKYSTLSRVSTGSGTR